MEFQLEIGLSITLINKKQNCRMQVIVTEIYERYIVVKGQDHRYWKEGFLKADLEHNIHPEFQFEFRSRRSEIA